MEWIEKLSHITQEDIQHFIQQYESLGPLPGILVPFLESFLPFLPILVIIMGNALVYDLWKGFLFSWMGIFLGSLSVFGLSRKYGGRFSSYIRRRYPKTQRFFNWVESKGFTPIFIMACLPFAPSFLVNVVAGLSDIQRRSFMIAIALGKGFMVFLVSLVGYDFFSIIQHPWKLILTVSLFFLIWIIGRILEARYISKIPRQKP